MSLMTLDSVVVPGLDSVCDSLCLALHWPFLDIAACLSSLHAGGLGDCRVPALHLPGNCQILCLLFHNEWGDHYVECDFKAGVLLGWGHEDLSTSLHNAAEYGRTGRSHLCSCSYSCPALGLGQGSFLHPVLTGSRVLRVLLGY